MKYCPTCQTAVTDGANKCPKCGYVYSVASPSPAVAGVAPTPTPAPAPTKAAADASPKGGFLSRLFGKGKGGSPSPSPATPLTPTPIGKDGVDYDAWRNHFRIIGNRVEYGIYPQEEVSLDSATINNLSLCPSDFGVYMANSGILYYEFGGKYYLVQPIKWKMLKREGDKALVIAEMILDASPYNKKDGKNDNSNDYRKSDARSFLLNNFVPSAFPDKGRRLLPYSKSEDRITLPSFEEMNDAGLGLDVAANRIGNLTDFAKMRLGSEWSIYHLRTATPDYTGISYVTDNGYIYNDGSLDSRKGIRPIMWISIKP